MRLNHFTALLIFAGLAVFISKDKPEWVILYWFSQQASVAGYRGDYTGNHQH